MTDLGVKKTVEEQIRIKFDGAIGGAQEEQKKLKLNQMAQNALVNLLVAIIQGKQK